MQKLKPEIRLVNISLTAWIFVFNWLCISWQQTSSDQKSFQINKTLKMYWSFRILFSATFGSWLHRNLSISCSLTCTKWANYVWKCNNFCVDQFRFPASIALRTRFRQVLRHITRCDSEAKTVAKNSSLEMKFQTKLERILMF